MNSVKKFRDKITQSNNKSLKDENIILKEMQSKNECCIDLLLKVIYLLTELAESGSRDIYKANYAKEILLQANKENIAIKELQKKLS